MRDEGLLSAIPYPIRIIIGILAHRKNFQALNGQGTGRFSDDEVAQIRSEAWTAIDGLVALQRPRATRGGGRNRVPFWVLGGENPTEIDATLFGFLTALLCCPANPENQKTVRSYPTPLEYTGRIHSTYFPDYERWDE